MISIEYLDLELLLSEISAAYTLAEALKLAVSQLSIQQHVKLSKYFFNRRLQQLMHLSFEINQLNHLRWHSIGSLQRTA